MATPDAQDEQVTWIGRDRVGFDLVVPEAPASVPTTPAGTPEEPGGLRKWLLPAGVVLVALLAASASFMLMGRKPHVIPLMHQEEVPLVTVMTPPVKEVTASVSFTGAIAARYDVPIGERRRHRANRRDLCRGGRPREERTAPGQARPLRTDPAGEPPGGLARAGARAGRPLGGRIRARQGRRSRRRAVRRRNREAARCRGHGCRERERCRRTARGNAGAPRSHTRDPAPSGRHRAHASRRARPDRRSGRGCRCFAWRAAERSRCAASSRSRISRRCRSASRRRST